MFGFRRKQGEILNHWIAFSEGFSYSPTEFYASVEKELADLKVPSMDISRIEFAEGGLLSDKRIYLRMIRERLAFDTCAAPFGTGFFFSCRTIYIPAVVRLWHVVITLLFLSMMFSLLLRLLGLMFAVIALVSLLIAIVQVFRNAVVVGLSDLDAMLIKTPVIGPIYERWFRKETYHRIDTRLVYLDTIPKVVKRLAEDIVGANGAKLQRQYEQAPILGELYKPIPLPSEAK